MKNNNSPLMVFVFTMLIITLSGCIATNPNGSAENTVSNYFNALQGLDFVGAYQQLSDKKTYADAESYAQQFAIENDENRLRLSMSTTQIVASRVNNDDKAIITIERTIPQIQTFDLLVPEIKANLEANNYPAVEERMQILINQGMIKVQTVTQTVQLQKQNDTWLIDEIN